MRVAIIGGGLGGLAAALFLRAIGLDAVVYEQASRLNEAGAGIVIPPNMVRVLRRLGLDKDLPEAGEFRGWDGRVHDLIAAATETRRWALFDRAPLESWTRGRITLLGDAAHAMLPFFAQGAAQAIEDALALAACLRTAITDSVEPCLLRYEAVRRPRVNHILMMSRGREVRNHLPDGPEQRQRDAELAVGEPLRQSAWLYGDAWEADLPGWA
jgi:2-polyprenyl-6-methoxyphenol hydroxylase-like FAD-dependent oxidoreductase